MRLTPRRTLSGSGWKAALAGLALAVGGLALLCVPRPRAEETIDLTLLFHSAVQGKIAPCG